MSVIGPTTGWLDVKNISHDVGEIGAAFHAAGAEAIEVLLHDDWCHLPKPAALLSANFTHVSLHLSSLEHFSVPGETLTKRQEHELRDLDTIVQQCGVQVAVAHPSFMPSHVYGLLKARDIPVAVENMDREKPVGKTVEAVVELMTEHAIPGVLDLQHGYECDRDAGGDGTGLNRALADAMLASHGIACIHVSGENEQTNHALVQNATNAEAILASLQYVLSKADVPIILEGEFLPDISVGYELVDENEGHQLLQQATEEFQCEVELLQTAGQ